MTKEFLNPNEEFDAPTPTWHRLLERLQNIDPRPLDQDRFIPSSEAVFFRGTSLADIAYALLESKGDLISPYRYKVNRADGYGDESVQETKGTIVTPRIAEAVLYANQQLQDKRILEKKQLWLGKNLNIEPGQIAEIKGLWQPFLLEFSNHIPGLVVERHFGELWTKIPVNLFYQEVTTRSLEELDQLLGTELIKQQRPSRNTLSEMDIKRYISESDATIKRYQSHFIQQ